MGVHFAKPELMSPAGYWPQLQAAVEAGADAVYFGLKHFTARAKVGFSLADLPDVMRTLHRRGVHGYVTFNSVVFDNELRQAAEALAGIAEAGADAIIVQDLGIARLARQIVPQLPIHGSTQMSITNIDGVRLAQRFGVSRVILARELSLAEVKAIHAETGCELEVFIHGALCVSYSGQCFSSEAWGGRSANRGQCAQACRLPYEMLVDEEVRPLGDARYLLSPGDLYTLQHVPEIVSAGVAALKIEGRYKDADYVALTTRSYRKALDQACAGVPVEIPPAEELQLVQIYSRGLGPHFISGTNHQRVVEGRAPRHRGVHLGRVAGMADGAVVLEPSDAHRIAPLKPGDGVVFDAADWRSPEEPEEGGRVYDVVPRNDGMLEVRFGNGALDFRRIRSGDRLWRTDDAELAKAARAFTEPAAPVARQPVQVCVTAREGATLVAEWRLPRQPGIRVRVASEAPLTAAHNRGLTVESLESQFGRLGNTPYALAGVELDSVGNPFAPASVLNRMRRQAVEALQERQGRRTEVLVHSPVQVVEQALAGIAQNRDSEAMTPRLHLLVRTPEQLEAAIARIPASITLDYLDLYGLGPSVERVRQRGLSVRVASPRVLKPGEERIVDFLLKLDCPILARSAGLVDLLMAGGKSEVTGDFSLNAANALTADLFLRMGIDRVTPSYDLNAAQVAELARQVGPHRVEAVAYQHLPVFHTEHCVFCRFLSTGTTYRDCGRPCEKHRVALRDASGRAHPVMADVGCRNTVFGAEAQEASAHLDEWREAGIRHFRLEFAHESGEQVKRVTQAFEETLAGRRTARELGRNLKQVAPQGATEGSLYVPSDYLRLAVLG